MLNPCPSCQATNAHLVVHLWSYHVECGTCTARGEAFILRDLAIDAWNRISEAINGSGN